MTDNAANIPDGPPSEAPATTTTSAHPVDAPAEGVVATPPLAPIAATPGSDVELIGRQTATAVTPGEGEAVGVGAGAAAIGTAAAAGATTGPSDPSPWSAPRWGAADDAPRWSYGVVTPPPGEAETAVVDGNQPELPFGVPEPRSRSAARALPMFGPIGRPRSALLVILLSVLTLGAYALGWHHRINRELEEFDPKLHSRPGRSMLAVLVPWLAGLAATLAGAAVIITTRMAVRLPFDLHVTTTQAYLLLAGLLAVPYLMLVLSFSTVAVVMTLERLRAVEEHVGATTDRQVRPVGNALLLAIPVIGGLILLAVEQRRLNAIWQAVERSGRTFS